MKYYINQTTTPVSPTTHPEDLHGYYAIITFVLFTLAACVLVMVIYFTRKCRSNELRHRLIPMYTYDPAEQDEDELEYRRRGDEERLEEPLYRHGKLSFKNDYGTE